VTNCSKASKSAQIAVQNCATLGIYADIPSPFPPLCSFVSFVVEVLVFNFGNYPILAILAISANAPFNSMTSIGHPGQLFSQHTIRSHPFGS
jgi:hypothetical protein